MTTTLGTKLNISISEQVTLSFKLIDQLIMYALSKIHTVNFVEKLQLQFEFNWLCF